MGVLIAIGIFSTLGWIVVGVGIAIGHIKITFD
jgi:hypothetical protein